MRRILVMGDEETIVGFISNALQEKGFKVIIVKSLEKAFLELAQNKYDIFLPTNFGIGPIEAIAVSRIKEKYPNLILIPISGYYHQHYVDELFSHGANDFLKAPFKVEDLVSKIQKIPSMDTLVLPDLITWNDKCFMILKFNTGTHTYEKNGDVISLSMLKLSSPVQEAFFCISKIISGAGNIYICSFIDRGITPSKEKRKCSIFKVGHNFQSLESKIFENIGDVVMDSSVIIISADGNLIIMDETLQDLGTVKLGIDIYGKPKNAHDILIFSRTAYLLDNIVHPMFILSVDIDYPEKMAVKRRIRIDEVNFHLENQWLEPDLEKWFVLGGYWHQGGSGQILYIFPMFDGDKPLVRQLIGKRDWDGGQKWGKLKGLVIISTTQFSPNRVLAMDKNGEYFLSQIIPSNKGVKFERILDIPELSKARMVKAQFIENLLFMMADNSLMVMDTQSDPISIVTSINLTRYGMDSIEGVTTIKGGREGKGIIPASGR